MKKTFTIVLFLTMTGAGYPQEKAVIRPDAAASKPAELGNSEPTPSSPETSAEYSLFTIAKQIDEVNLILSVTDSKGRFVDNLIADDLKLFDNHKTPARLTYFQAHTNLPLSIVLAVDISSSVRDRLHFEQQAASAFLKHILRAKTDEATIVAFGSTVQEKSAGMTSDLNTLIATVGSLQAGGETAMYDAIVLAGYKLHASRRRTTLARPVIILITDGVDTASKASLRAAEEAATRSEAAIFALDANSVYETNPKGRLILDRLTLETGGFVFSARENSDLKGAFNTIEKMLRSQYALGYSPPDLEMNGSFRSIEVTCAKPGLKIHARKGYYAPAK